MTPLQYTDHRPWPLPARPWVMAQVWHDLFYCLYSMDKRGRIYQGEIHHAPWPVQKAEATFERNSMAQATGLALPDRALLLHFARRLVVCAWAIRPVGEK